jgi:hypothetical protein
MACLSTVLALATALALPREREDKEDIENVCVLPEDCAMTCFNEINNILIISIFFYKIISIFFIKLLLLFIK